MPIKYINESHQLKSPPEDKFATINVQQHLAIWMPIPTNLPFTITLTACALGTCYGVIYFFKKDGITKAISMYHAMSGRIQKSPEYIGNHFNMSDYNPEETECIIAVPTDFSNPNDKGSIIERMHINTATNTLHKYYKVPEPNITVTNCYYHFAVNSLGNYGNFSMGNITYGTLPSCNQTVNALDIINPRINEILHKRKLEEMRTTGWIPDAHSDSCANCNTPITKGCFSTNKHHCRMCGKIICARCVTERPIKAALRKNSGLDRFNDNRFHTVKICRKCHSQHMNEWNRCFSQSSLI